MRFMVMVKATQESEAGVMPSEELLAAMGRYNEELVKAGIDAEPIIRRAIKRCGLMHGENFKKQCADPTNSVDFKDAFLGDDTKVGPQSFHMSDIKADHDNVTVDFHYCALVSAWKKLGFSDETCALLCDMAMDGDRGIAEAMGLTPPPYGRLARNLIQAGENLADHLTHFYLFFMPDFARAAYAATPWFAETPA